MTTRMITCCPACSTLFKVAPEQLQIAGGWVRCGQCMAVFDARARMLPADPYVPSDFGWQEETEESDALPTGFVETITHTESQTEAEALAPAAPRPGRKSPAAAMPAAATPAFEPASPAASAFDPVASAVPAFELVPPAPAFALAPPPAPEAPVAAPVFTEPAPATAAAPKASTADRPPKAAATFPPPFSFPTNDELDRRHAQLLEKLAQLRELAERRKNEPEDAPPAMPGDAGTDPAARAGESSSRPHHAAATEDAGRDARPHGALTDRAAQPRGRKREDKRRGQKRGAARDTRPPQPQESGQDPPSRPVIDFVLSEIGRLPLSVFAPSQLEQQTQAAPAEPEVPTFIEQARRRAFWALPLVRAGLWIAALALGMTLAAQIAVNQRDRIAAQYPGAIPLLQTLCRPTQCRIGPWRHLGAVTIDSSAFVRTGPEGFRFAVTLRNGNAAPVATPALELALIDAQDQPLARRILNPADWGAPPQLAGYGEFNGAAALTVLDSAHPQAVSNYRLAVFYP